MVEMFFGIEGPSKYRGYTDGRTWNGWQCPCFTFEVAQQIAKDFSGEGGKLIYDEVRDCFIYETDDYPGEDGERFEACTVNGEKLYPIGAGSWCWDGEPIKA